MVLIDGYLAIELMNKKEFDKAIYHLQFIEYYLQKDYKDCLNKIEICKSLLNNQVSEQNQFQSQQLEQQKQFVIKYYEEIEKANQKQQNIPPNHTQHIPQESEANEKVQLITQNYEEQNQSNQVAIYYNCKKNPQCQNYNQNVPFKHSECKTTAFLNADGQISCQQQSCQTFFVKDALFSCQTSEVIKKNEQIQQDNLEAIINLQMLADFVVNCLQRSLLPESEQQQFRELFPSLALPEMTKRGYM